MATTIQYVPAGTTGPVNFATPLTSVYAAPQVLGGTVQLWYGPSPVGPFQLWSAGTSVAGDSFRPLINSYYYVVAATQQAVVAATDMGGANSPAINQLVCCNAVLASPSATAINKVYSIKIPPLFLPLNFRITVFGSVNVTNNANVKTLTCLVNGITGTSFFTSPSLASVANYNFIAAVAGDGTGQLLRGFGAGASGGVGTSTTAQTTLVRDYINNETEIVIAATNATGTDTFELNGLVIKLD